MVPKLEEVWIDKTDGSEWRVVDIDRKDNTLTLYSISSTIIVRVISFEHLLARYRQSIQHKLDVLYKEQLKGLLK